ncbi:MAG: hypothetical protein ACRC1D_03585 [Culicoidibacterales bacterium]
MIQSLALGNSDPKFGEFINKAMSANNSNMQVCDSKQNPLQKDGIYFLNGQKVQIISEHYGQGNIMDTYYHVLYRKEDFSKSSICIDGLYLSGWRNGVSYISPFNPL